MRHARLAAAALLALFVSAAAPANAGDPTAADVGTARDLFREGSSLANDGRWEEAADRFRRSLTLKRAAITLYSLGLSLESSGHLVEALEAYRAFLAEPVVDATRQFVAPAREAVAALEPKIGHLRIDASATPGLRVTVDGLLVPTAALSARRPIDPGKHVVVASAAGYKTLERSIDVGPGALETVELTLEAETTAAARPGKQASPAPGEPPPPSAPKSDASSPVPVGPIVLLVSGAAVFGVGLAVGLIGVAEASDAPEREGPEADAAMVKATAGDVVAGVGIAAAAAGAIWLIVEATQGPQPPRTALRVWSGGGALGLAIDFH